MTETFAQVFARVGKEQHEELLAWIDGLRRLGVKAAHPDDGHVERDRSQKTDFVSFSSYVHFNDGVKMGDLIALGWPNHYRVRVVLSVGREGFILRRDVYQVAK